MSLEVEIEKPNSRRVPDTVRRRAQFSCDRCKLRRIRCVRLNKADACESCEESKSSCKSTIPRKARFSTSSDGLNNSRYQALDALVKGIFPDEDCDDIQTLFRLGLQNNIVMPGAVVSDSGVQFHNGRQHSQAIDGLQTNPAAAATHPSGSSAQACPETNNTQTSLSAALAELQPWPLHVDLAVQGAVNLLEEETCIPAPHGVQHYVGPASSFEFANAIRRLVTLRSELIEDTRKRQDRKSRLRAEFTNLRTSIALEPRIQTHPASIVQEPTTSPHVQGGPAPSLPHDSPASSRYGDTMSRASIFNLASVRAQMPSRQLADRLIKTFFEKVHPSYALFHRGTFYTQYESIWQRHGSPQYELDPGYICSLLMVYVFGALLLEHEGLEWAAELQRKYLRMVRECFHNLALSASLTNVQSLLLLQLYEHNAGERNTSWILLGQAARMAIALGMHREGTSHNFDVIERNARKLVWFTLYSFEQYASLTLGRPSTIKALEANVKLPEEAMVDGNDHPPDYFAHASILLDITSKVRQFATASSPHCFNSQFLNSMLDNKATIMQDLDAWFQRLPRHLSAEWSFSRPQHLRTVLLLHINYHYLVSVLTRPYLLCKVDHDIRMQAITSPSNLLHPIAEITKQAEQCITSSIAVADLLQRLSTESLLEGSCWIDFFYSYHAMLVLCLDFLGHPHRSPEDWTARDREISDSVSTLIEMRQIHQLSPTSRILTKVSLQFANIVGLANDRGTSRASRAASVHIPGTQTHDDANPVSGISNNASQQNQQQYRQPGSLTSQDINTQHTESADLANLWQYPGVFMPFAEPISGISQFNDDNVFWDFFNVGGIDSTENSNPAAGHGSFTDPSRGYGGYGYGAGYGGGTGGWHG